MLIVKAIGSRLFEDDKKDYRDALLKRIGASLPPEDQVLTRYGRFRHRVWEESGYPDPVPESYEDTDQAMKGPWKPDDLPYMAQWLAENESPMDALCQAGQRPKFFLPLVPGALDAETFKHLDSVLGERIDAPTDFPPLYSTIGTEWHLRLVGGVNGLLIRGNLAAWNKQPDRAWGDFISATRLALLAGRCPFLIDQLVANGMLLRSHRAIRGFLEESRLTANKARAMLRQWQDIPAMPSAAERTAEAERYVMLELLCWGSRSPGDLRRLLSLSVFASEWMNRTLYGQDSQEADDDCWADKKHAETVELLIRRANWDTVLRAANSSHDESARTLAKSRKERMKLLAEGEVERKVRWKRANQLPDATGPVTPTSAKAATNWLIDALLSSPESGMTQRILDSSDLAATEHELVGLALALAAYRAEKGEHPEKLADLSPEYLKEIGQDLFSGKPYVYRRLADGYVLYSVGLNGEDDGGVDAGTSFEDGDADDIVVFVAR
ncbi:MAG: hypothetical protein ACYS8X_02575 [Planctomycetota bacterium]